MIERNGMRITVLRGSPRLEITAPPGIFIKTGRNNAVAKEAGQRPKRSRADQ